MRAEDSALRARRTPRAASAQSGAPRPRRAPARSPNRARLAGPPRTPGSAPRRARVGLDHRSKDPSGPAPARGGRDTTARPATRLRTARRACARRPPRVSGRPRRCAPRRRASWRRSPRRGGPAWRPCDGAAAVTLSWRVRRSLRGHRLPCDPRVTARQLLRVARRRALFPQLPARPRPVDAFALGDGARERFTGAPNEAQRVAPFVAYDRGPDVDSLVVPGLRQRRRHRLT